MILSVYLKMGNAVCLMVTCGGYRMGRVLLAIGLLHNMRIGICNIYRSFFL